MNLPTAIQPENKNGNGQFVAGNTAGRGQIRGIRNQLTALRDCIFDELLDLRPDGTTRLKEAMANCKHDVLLGLAARLVPKSVELSISNDNAPLPIVLDAFPRNVIDKRNIIEKPVMAMNHNGRKKLLGLQAVELN